MSKTLNWIAGFLASHPVLDDVLLVAAWSAGAAIAADVLVPMVSVIHLPPAYAFAGPLLNSVAYAAVRYAQAHRAAALAKAAQDGALTPPKPEGTSAP